MHKSVFTVLIMLAFSTYIIASNIVPFAYADKGGKPNDHASDVAKPTGATSNKEFFQECKDSGRSSSDCSHDPEQVGKYIHGWAHEVNKK
jgi:hypothetical protein